MNETLAFEYGLAVNYSKNISNIDNNKNGAISNK